MYSYKVDILVLCFIIFQRKGVTKTTAEKHSLLLRNMNTACSSCLELFTSRSNISTTPCGHVFHTECITKWLQDRQKNCAQCRKSCTVNQIVKLYFSEGDPENNLVAELIEENIKLKNEANSTKSENLILQTDIHEANSKIRKLQTKANSEKSENLRLQTETDAVKSENVRLQSEIDSSNSENLSLLDEIDKTKSEHMKIQTKANAQKSDILKLKSETNSVRSENSKLRTEVKALKSDNRRLVEGE